MSIGSDWRRRCGAAERPIRMAHRATDDTGREFVSAGVPRRVVSLVPSVTELVCALGCTAQLVARTRYCTHPEAVVSRLVAVGGTKDPDCDAIIALRPDVVLVNSEENRIEDVQRLKAADVRVFVTFPNTVAAAAQSAVRLGHLLGADVAADRLAAEIDAARLEVAAGVGRRSSVFCPVWRNPWMSFNGDTYAHDLLRCAGGDSVCEALTERYPEVDLAEVARSQPEVILLPDEPYRFAKQHLSSLTALADTPAWRARRIHFVDGKALWWYGPRTPSALRYFQGLLRSPR